MLTRVLEPEVMDDSAEAAEYEAMDHSAVNAVFVADLLAALTSVPSASETWQVLDVGAGPAHIPVELARALPNAQILAVDLSGPMLALAERRVFHAGLAHRIQLRRADSASLLEPDACFNVVCSNSLMHHLANPADSWIEMWRVLRPGGLMFLRDLARPDSHDEVERLVKTYTHAESLASQQLFRQSLQAALTVSEVQNLAESLGLHEANIAATSDRHWTLTAVKPAACDAT